MNVSEHTEPVEDEHPPLPHGTFACTGPVSRGQNPIRTQLKLPAGLSSYPDLMHPTLATYPAHPHHGNIPSHEISHHTRSTRELPIQGTLATLDEPEHYALAREVIHSIRRRAKNFPDFISQCSKSSKLVQTDTIAHNLDQLPIVTQLHKRLTSRHTLGNQSLYRSDVISRFSSNEDIFTDRYFRDREADTHGDCCHQIMRNQVRSKAIGETFSAEDKMQKMYESSVKTKTPFKPSYKNVTRALGGPTKKVADLMLEKYKLHPPLKPLTAYNAFSSWKRYEIKYGGKTNTKIEDVIYRCRVIGPNGYMIAIRGHSKLSAEERSNTKIITASERNHLVAHAWSSLSSEEKEIFHQISGKDKVRYARDLELYFTAINQAKVNAREPFGKEENC